MQANRQQEINNINFRVLSRQKTLKNLQRIVQTIQYGVLAKYNLDGKFWSYQKIKGPLFLVLDSYKQHKLVILNQCMAQNYIFKLQPQTRIQLKKVKDAFLFNYTFDDSITGIAIFGIWTMDPKIQNLYLYLTSLQQKQKSQPIKS